MVSEERPERESKGRERRHFDQCDIQLVWLFTAKA
jgi:hypothetical protein